MTSAMYASRSKATRVERLNVPSSKPSGLSEYFLPPVAPYDLIGQTTAGAGPPTTRPAHGIKVTSGSLDAAIAGMVSGAFLVWSVDVLKRQLGVPAVAIGVVVGAAVALMPSRTTSTSDAVQRLREAIQDGGNLTRAEIAALIGVDRRSLSAWGRGETAPSRVNFERLRSLASLVERLNRVGINDLVAVLRDAETAGVVTDALRASDVDLAIAAVLGDDDADVVEAPLLTAAQWRSLVRLAQAEGAVETSSDLISDVEPEHPPRARLDRAWYTTRHRPWRQPRG